MIKNAIAYITRKKIRTFIIFIILTIVFSCLYSCLTLMKSSNSFEKSLYKISDSSLAITKKDGGNFDKYQFRNLEKIKGIEEIVFQYSGLAKPKDTKVVAGEQKIRRDDLPDEFNSILSVSATNNTKKDIFFSSGVFKIKTGRHIEKNDKRKILIHEKSASKNNLKLNDEIKLRLIDPETKKKNKEVKFQIVGIFSGKKQEKYTGLSSDFSENTVFVDYNTSQKALKRYGTRQSVDKISIFSSGAETTNSVLRKIKELKVDWSKYIIEKENKSFEKVLESISGIKHIIKIMTYSIMLAGTAVLSLILILWLRERIYEIGVLFSIGISKIRIITQFVLELIFVSIPSIAVSWFLGDILMTRIVGEMNSSENSALIADTFLNKDSKIINLITFAESYSILVCIIILSVILACTMILIKKPKEILSKIS